jgi:dTDP-4-amino-4,6-dideoxygalactose transaminase
LDRGVPLTRLDYDRQGEDAVVRILRSKWLTIAVVIHEFETKFSEMVRVQVVVLVSSQIKILQLVKVENW